MEKSRKSGEKLGKVTKSGEKLEKVGKSRESGPFRSIRIFIYFLNFGQC